jgi:hypothetical protein
VSAKSDENLSGIFPHLTVTITTIISWLEGASVQGETPIHLLGGSTLRVPRRHRAVMGEPNVPEPIRSVVHPSVDIPESMRNPDGAAALQPPRHYAAGVGVPFEQLPAPASSALSGRLKTTQSI